MTLLAHGGIPGLIAETSCVIVALGVFGYFVRRSAKKEERERNQASEASDPDGVSDRDSGEPSDRTGPAPRANQAPYDGHDLAHPNRPAVKKGATGMRKAWAFMLLAVVGAVLAALFVGRLGPGSSNASSHREAPLISEDPTADNTDLYAFRSPDKPNTLTIVSNWIPGEDPAAGPNYYTFSQSAKYNIYVDRKGDGRPELTYSFRFKTPTGPYFLGNTQQNWTATLNGKPFASGKTPINNIGPRFNGFVGVKDYEAAAEKTIVTKNGVSIFAGQRDDPFFADVGAIFDLVAIRKAGTTGNMGGGKDFLSGYNVHAIALQIPISQVDTKSHTLGVWSSTDRMNVTVNGKLHRGWTQVSRLGNPLINEVVIPTGLKDLWNRTSPRATCGSRSTTRPRSSPPC